MKSRLSLKLLVVVTACLLADWPARGNLILNPGFESSQIGWLPVPSPNDPWDANIPDRVQVVNVAYSGSKAVQLVPYPVAGAIGYAGVLQTVSSLIPGQDYVLGFWARSTAGVFGYLAVGFGPGGVVPYNQDPGNWVIPGQNPWTHYEVTLTAPPTGWPFSDQLFIGWNSEWNFNPVPTLYLDAVSLTVVPEPSTVALLLLAFGVGAFRRLRKPRPA